MAVSSPRRIFLSDIGEVDAPNNPDAWLGFVGLIATRMLPVLPTEQDHWWFMVEQFDRAKSYCKEATEIMDTSPISLHEIEYEGRRSEKSYIGAPNPGVVFLQRVTQELAHQFNPTLAEVVVANVYVSYATACLEVLERLRLKYAVHFHNNCVVSKSFGHADQWNEVIQNLGGD